MPPAKYRKPAKPQRAERKKPKKKPSTVKIWLAKKRVAFEKHMHREPQEPMGDLVAKTLAYLASKGKNDYTVKEIKEGEKMHGVVISGGETRKVIAGDSAEEVWVQIERLY